MVQCLDIKHLQAPRWDTLGLGYVSDLKVLLDYRYIFN
jgi:hypothetical protein